MKPEDFFCRELGLIKFNERVLAQAFDLKTPLLEKLKFICIVSSNLDEFFEVRIAALKRLHNINPAQILMNGETPGQVLKNVRKQAGFLIRAQYQLLNEVIFPALAKKKILFLKREDWDKKQADWIKDYFTQQIKPIITPIGLDPAHPFPKLLNKSLNFIIQLEGIDVFGRANKLAVLEAPRILPRLVKLPPELSNGQDIFIFLSSIIHDHIEEVFLGMKIKGFYQFRVTRDSELILEDDDLQNLLTAVQGELVERQYGKAVRLEIADNCPDELIDYLTNLFHLGADEVYKVAGPVNLMRLCSVLDLISRPDLKFAPKVPTIPALLQNETSIYEILREQDVLLHHPYQSFQPFVEFIEGAAGDSQVVAIKMTIYRTGIHSDIIKALMKAAAAKKEVTVVVELMARFDEEFNVYWANQLEDAGAHVVYGVVGYKVHAKMALVLRKEDGQLKRYGHLGTGNYHQGTAKLYTDFGLLTADPDITGDMNDIFIQITGLGRAEKLKKLLQSPFTLHPLLIDAIEREIRHAKKNKPAKITAKMNALTEPQLIEKLYEASAAGVEIDLIVRGVCALKPGVAGLSEHIRVRSIIGRLLEHSRIFYFYNNGAEDTYLSSADWMTRNMFERVETCVPVSDAKIKARIIYEALTVALQDNQLAWEMKSNGNYARVAFNPPKDKPVNLHETLFNLHQC